MSNDKTVIDRQFKMDAVEYVRNHPELTRAEVCANLGISTSSIYRWIKEAEESEGTNSEEDIFRGSGNFSSEEAKELAKLRKESRDLKDALEILKKAMGILADR